MLTKQVAQTLNIDPEHLEKESLRAYLQNQLRLIESEFFLLSKKYGIKNVQEFDDMIQTGKFHEAKAFEDFFKLDYLENEREKLLKALETVK